MGAEVSKKTFGIINTLAIKTISQTVNTTCIWAFYQPKLPEAAVRKVK